MHHEIACDRADMCGTKLCFSSVPGIPSMSLGLESGRDPDERVYMFLKYENIEKLRGLLNAHMAQFAPNERAFPPDRKKPRAILTHEDKKET